MNKNSILFQYFPEYAVKFLYKLINLGVKSNLDASKTIKATNSYSLTLFVCALIVSTTLWILNIKLMSALAFIICLLFYIPCLLNHKGKHNLARLSFVLIFNAAIYIYSTSLGSASSTDGWFMTSAILAFSIYGWNEPRRLTTAAVLPITLLLFVHITNFQYSILPVLKIDNSVLLIISFVMLFLSTLVSISLICHVSWILHSHATKLAHVLARRISHDLSEQQLKIEQIKIVQKIERCLVNATDEYTMMQSIFHAVTEQLNWKVGLFWELNNEKTFLTCTNSFAINETNARNFAEKSQSFSFRLGEGLPGRVWQDGKSLWLADLINDKNLPRISLTQQTGIEQLFEVPIEFGDTFFGCVEFATSYQSNSSRKIIEIFNEISPQIAQRMQFFRTKQLADKHHKLLQSILDGYSEPVVVRSSDGHFQIVNQAAAKSIGVSNTEILNSTPWDLVSKDIADESEKEHQLVIATGKSISKEKVYVLQGEQKHFLVHRFPIFESNNSISSVCSIATNISAQKEFENKLINTTNGVPSLIANCDKNLCFQFANKTYCDWFGVTLEKIKTMTLPEILGSEQYEKSKHLVQLALEGKPQQFERELIRKVDGQKRWIIVNYLPDNINGQIRGFFIHKQDVTELKIAEEKAKENAQIAQLSSNRLSLALTSGQIAVWSIDLKSEEVWQSENYHEIFGHSKCPDNWTLNTFFNQVFSDDLKIVKQNMEIVKSKGYTNFHCRIIRADDQSIRWIQIVSHVIHEGSFSHMMGTVRDVTREKEQEKIRNMESELIQAILNATPYSVISTDPNGIIRTFNNTAEKMLGYKAEELIGKSSPSILHDSNEVIARTIALNQELNIKIEPGIETFFAKPKMLKTPYENEWIYIHKNGSRFPVSLIITVLYDINGNITGYLGSAIDLTERKEAQKQLEDALRKAEAGTIAKAEFIATMSHEIRTPLNGIIGMTELLLKTKLEEIQHRYALIIKQSGQSLLDIVNDILDFSKIEAGKMEVENVEFNITNMIENQVDLFSAKVQEKNISLTTVIDPQIPTHLKGDPGKIAQVLRNLLSNAIKFTSKGSIVMKVEIDRATKQKISLRFSVTDTGIGLTKSAKDRLFQPFTQADNSTARKFGGTGLGLSICKRMIDLMRGQIGVESEIHKGSTFFFICDLRISHKVFDVKNTEKQKNKKVTETKKRPKRILIAEDNSVNQLLITTQLESLGYEIYAVNNGQEAVDAYTKKEFDLIIMDGHMPEMDGFKAAETIRKLEETTGKHIPIIALTANAAADDKKICLDSGMDDYLSKPAKEEAIVNMIKHWILK